MGSKVLLALVQACGVDMIQSRDSYDLYSHTPVVVLHKLLYKPAKMESMIDPQVVN